MNNDLTNKLSGMARNAPLAPRIVAQMIKDRKLRVAERPTVTPTTRGWMIVWMTKFKTQ